MRSDRSSCCGTFRRCRYEGKEMIFGTVDPKLGRGPSLGDLFCAWLGWQWFVNEFWQGDRPEHATPRIALRFIRGYHLRDHPPGSAVQASPPPGSLRLCDRSGYADWNPVRGDPSVAPDEAKRNPGRAASGFSTILSRPTQSRLPLLAFPLPAIYMMDFCPPGEGRMARNCYPSAM